MEETVKDRLVKFIKEKGYSQGKLEKELKWSNGYVNSVRDNMGAKHLQSLIGKFPDLNRDWLITGTGTMFKIDATAQSVAEAEQKQAERNSDVLMVPVINLDARGGLLPNEVVDIQQYTQGVLPFGADVARPGDFAMMVHGDSMYPRYPGGCYILLREVPMWREYIELSLPYLIELMDDRRVAKIIMKGPDADHFTLRSVNPSYEDTEIARSFVRRVFQIVVMLKKEIV